VYLDYSSEQKALQAEVRDYFARLLTPEVRAELGRQPGEHCPPAYRRVVRQMGQDGWLGIGWPEEYGGRGRPPIDQYIFFDEVDRAGAPFPLVTLNTVGPTLMQFGTDEQRQRFLPQIVGGEIHFAIGYTEPGAGTDLASLTTRAVVDNGHYVVSGQKVFTTGAHDADYIWLAVRTDVDAPKHKGISILLVDTSLPGFSCSPIYTLDGGRTNAVFLDDVRVPTSMLVGPENKGWRLITTQLNHERVALAASGKLERILDDVVRIARDKGTLGDQSIQLALARVRAKLEALKLLNWRMAWGMARGELNPAASSAVKVYGSELYVEAYATLLEVVGEAGLVESDSPGAILNAELEHAYRAAFILTFGGGVNEVQREIIATTGLAVPRSDR